MVNKVKNVIQSHFEDPFDDEPDKKFCIIQFQEWQNRLNLCQSSSNFLKQIKQIAFHDAFKKFPFKNAKEISVKAKVSRNEKQREFHIKRDILGKLVSISTTYKVAIDNEKALSYPLTPAYLSLLNWDMGDSKKKKSPSCIIVQLVISKLLVFKNLHQHMSCQLTSLTLLLLQECS